MGWSANDIATLEETIKSGVLTVRYSGPPAREVTYQSLAEMRKLLAEMRSQVSSAPRARRGIVDRGV